MKTILMMVPTFLIATIVAFLVQTANAGVIVPNAQTSVEGNSNNAFPFRAVPAEVRYQQVFRGSEFGYSGSQNITQIKFRPDVGASAFSGNITDIMIWLSTTSAAPDGLSATFSANRGGNETLVHDGPLTLTTAFTGPAGGPKDFDIVIDLETLFAFNPDDGNLLLEVRRVGGPTLGQFDAQFTSGDAVSRAYVFDADGTTAQGLDSLGLVAEFNFSPVPEPASLAIFGTICLVACRRRKQQP